MDRPTRERLARMGLRELVDHIIGSHHATLRVQMPRALRLLEQCSAHHSQRSATLAALGDVLRPMWQEMNEHIVREEQVVFPAIVLLDHARSRPGLHDGRITAVIRDLEHDHDLATDALKVIRDLTNGFEKPSDADPAYCELMDTLVSLNEDLIEHTHVEDAILFPKAKQVEAELSRRS